VDEDKVSGLAGGSLMKDMQTYTILLRGRIDPEEIGPASPLQMKTGCLEGPNTKFEVRTDQSGVIGLLRFLHGRGFVILSLNHKHDREK
jgi:hypothetical protein